MDEINNIKKVNKNEKGLYNKQVLDDSVIMISHGCNKECLYCSKDIHKYSSEIYNVPVDEIIPSIEKSEKDTITLMGQDIMLYEDIIELLKYGLKNTNKNFILRTTSPSNDNIYKIINLANKYTERLVVYNQIGSLSEEGLMLLDQHFTLKEAIKALDSMGSANIVNYMITGFPGEDDRMFKESLEKTEYYKKKGYVFFTYGFYRDMTIDYSDYKINDVMTITHRLNKMSDVFTTDMNILPYSYLSQV